MVPAVESESPPMWTRQHRKNSHARLVMPALAAMFLAYFGFHLVNGTYGLLAKSAFEEERSRLEAELATQSGERVALERRIALLRDGSIERDMLDEQIRRALYYAGPSDLVVLR